MMIGYYFRSMVRAVKGMIAEKRGILYISLLLFPANKLRCPRIGIFTSFTIALVAFQFMSLATTWYEGLYLLDNPPVSVSHVDDIRIVMKFYGACSCTVLLLVGGTYWYKYCLRIYNRFKFIEPDIEWRNSDVDNSEMGTTDPSGRRTGVSRGDRCLSVSPLIHFLFTDACW